MEIIIGAAVSLIIQVLKERMGLGEYGTLLVLFLMAVLGAGIYTALVAADMWQTVFEVMVLAGSFYTFIIARFTKGSTLSKALGNG